MSLVEFQIEIGNTSKQVERDGKNKYAWNIYLNAGGQANKIQKVVFLLHESFKHPEVSVEKPDDIGVFASREFLGWGTFQVGVVIHWQPIAVCRSGKTTELSHELSFSAAKTTSMFEVSNDGGYTQMSKAVRSMVGVFAPLALQVVTLSGEELLSVSEAGDMTCSDVLHALEDQRPLLPGHEYKLAHGGANVTHEQKMCDLDAVSGELKLNAVIQRKPSWQEDLNLALIKSAQTLDLAQIKTLLSAGASAAFVHDPPGTWGSCDAKSALHVAIRSRPRAGSGCEASPLVGVDDWIAVIDTLLEAKADVNAQQRNRDWRGCGSSSTAFEMILPAAMNDAALLQTFLVAGANPNTESRRQVHSMRSDGGSCHCVLHTAVSSGNLDVVKTLLDAKADANARSTEKISNERGHNRDMSETSLHIACKRGYVEASALLLEHRADPNAIRHDLITEDIPEAELIAREPRNWGKIKGMMCDDPRDPEYVCPVRSVAVEETSLHIALRTKHEGLVTLLTCSGADKCIPRKQGETSTSVVDLCTEEASLLHAISATWPLAATCQLFSDAELTSVKAAIAATQTDAEVR